ncbi:hypothetical protein ACFYZB_23590 [Streptomyces sp. NPDC001852]|uniref:hypothetical protein n=1 Tax=Streptomyces sp. NPDC001852 TaxID=3364619 RepID=UPI0036A02A06
MSDWNARRTAGERSLARRSAGVAMTALVVLAAAACQGQHKSFPGALQGQDTDVSAAEVFHHHGVKTPPSMRNLRYSALSSDDTYPLVAFFSADCGDVPGFTARSSLRRVSYAHTDTSDVDVFAKRFGWARPAPGDSWYKSDSGQDQTVEALVHQAAGKCTVYLTA